ncbi:MAG: hypothetical protein JWQ14_85 [Adhaeribacter sp.]|nr:hypothetical protein [Adhaeribacter sp.]
MLELLFALLLQLSAFTADTNKSFGLQKSDAVKATTQTTISGTSTTPLKPSIGSGGWDDKN